MSVIFQQEAIMWKWSYQFWFDSDRQKDRGVEYARLMHLQTQYQSIFGS